jgi:hypothetical protein
VARTISPPANALLATRSIIVDATRCWRLARDSHSPVQPALYQALLGHSCAVLTPVLDSLLALYETFIGRRLRAGASGQTDISGDEHDLLDLLAGPDSGDDALPAVGASPGLAGALRIALRSARIMLRLALEPAEQPPSLRLLATT